MNADNKDGQFRRAASQFRSWITVDGRAGPTGKDGFQAEAGRYHLYVSYACPWAHRILIFRRLKWLESIISISVVNPLMLDDGWTFFEPDPQVNAQALWQIYQAADPRYTGRASVPVLWDKHLETIVSNESADIIRMFNGAFAAITNVDYNFYPSALAQEIDELNDIIYRDINNGVYEAGFATAQEAYATAVSRLFSTLDMLDSRLADRRYLMGSRITEADWRLFTTLVRFDAVYYGHFKCNIRRIVDYPSLWGYVRDLYQQPGVAETVRMDHIKSHYYGSHRSINPNGIVPVGPEIDFRQPHDRQRL